MEAMFPNGWTSYALGGLLIGAGIALAHLLTGRIAGISSIFTAAHSWWSRSSGVASAAPTRPNHGGSK